MKDKITKVISSYLEENMTNKNIKIGKNSFSIEHFIDLFILRERIALEKGNSILAEKMSICIEDLEKQKSLVKNVIIVIVNKDEQNYVFYLDKENLTVLTVIV